LTESLVEMITFLTALPAAGWTVGAPFPSGAALLPASGAAFMAVVAGQMANAFACRSEHLRPWQLGWFSNRYLLLAVVFEGAMLVGFLYIRPLANLLGQAPPTGRSCVMALVAVPAVLVADAVQKHYRASWRQSAAT
jgi:hypothetical protein